MLASSHRDSNRGQTYGCTEACPKGCTEKEVPHHQGRIWLVCACTGAGSDPRSRCFQPVGHIAAQEPAGRAGCSLPAFRDQSIRIDLAPLGKQADRYRQSSRADRAVQGQGLRCGRWSCAASVCTCCACCTETRSAGSSASPHSSDRSGAKATTSDQSGRRVSADRPTYDAAARRQHACAFTFGRLCPDATYHSQECLG